MEPLNKRYESLKGELDAALEKLDITAKAQQMAQLDDKLAEPDVWQDTAAAQALSKQAFSLHSVVGPWLALKKQVSELNELISLGDEELKDEIESNIAELEDELAQKKKDLMFTGPFDDHDVILRLSAGVGGTDAQDWTEMLLRMYTRWAEKAGMKSELIEQSAGEEAGLKSAVLSIAGPYAYGKLQGEHGVHRLVRLSPFNADNLRQTSFALVEVLPQIDAPDEVVIDDKDLKIDVFRAGGHGGQSVNTTDSAVRVTHLPTGIVVSIQNERSQLQNKETALKVLRSKLAQLQIEQHKENLADLKGPTKSAEWGAQIRNYVLHPYTMVKDTRTKHEERDAQSVLDGKLDGFIDSYLEK